MSQRDVFLKEFRGKTIGSITDQSSVEEQFQNEVLRPILKLQNDLIILSFQNYLSVNKINFNSFTVDKKVTLIENSIHKDSKLRDTFKGIIIGLFTSNEYSLYATNSSNINKRIITMLVERLQSQIQLLEINT
jgi:hypothetical protein